MDFLNKAIFSSADQGLLGMIITTFDPSDVTGRAVVRLMTADELFASSAALEPRGFQLTPDGTLRSDTASRQVIADSIFSYITEESLKFGPNCWDITDLVLMGVKHNGYVLPRYDPSVEDADGVVNGNIIVPFSRFNVSASSFNIYASYLVDEGQYRTVSLLSLEDGSPEPFYCMFPAGTLTAPDTRTVTLIKQAMLGDQLMDVFYVTGGMGMFYTEVGEAFLNYLAYNVSFYNIGEKTITELKKIVPELPRLPVERVSVYDKRKPLINVSIKHNYKKTRLDGMIDILGDSNRLIEYQRTFPEAAITYNWLQRIMNSPWVVSPASGVSMEQSIYNACLHITNDCRVERLKFALELLRHRYYIAMMGVGNDTLGSILTGGGVRGQSIKRASF